MRILFVAVVGGALVAGCCGARRSPTAEAEPVAPVIAPAVSAAPGPPLRPKPALLTRLEKLIHAPSSERTIKVATFADGVERSYAPGKEAKEIRLLLPPSYVAPKPPSEWLIQVFGSDLTAEDVAGTTTPEEPCSQEGLRFVRIKEGALAGAYAVEGRAWIKIVTPGFEWQLRKPLDCLLTTLCSTDVIPGLHKLDAATFTMGCEQQVKARLKSPASAEFQGLFDGRQAPTATADCGWKWASYVDAKNAFGVDLRSNFTCTWDTQTDMIEVKLSPQ